MAEVFKPRPGLHRFPDSNDLREYLDRLNKGIHDGAKAVRGGARWVARDWHWAGIVPPIGLLAGVSQAENISQAAIQTWEQIHPSTPVVKTIDNPQADSIVVPIASPMVEPTALPTPQAPEPEGKAGAGPNPPDNDPDKEPEVKDDIKPKADDVKQTEEPKGSKIEPAQKPLPAVINEKTVEYESPSSKETERMQEEAGEFKLAMPKNIQKLSLEETSDPKKPKALAVRGLPKEPGGSTEKPTYELPALTKGRIIDVTKGGNFSYLAVEREDGKKWLYLFPPSSSFKVKEGATINEIGQILASFTYDPNDPAIQNFINFLKTQVSDAPSDSLYLIGGRDNTPSISRDNIQRSESGKVITTP